MFWNKKKEPLDYPSVEVYKSLRQQRVDMENEAVNAEYEYALARAREFVQQQMWKGHRTILVSLSSVSLSGGYREWEGLSKETYGRISLDNRKKVINTLIEELIAKGFTHSAPWAWNDTYEAIMVNV